MSDIAVAGLPEDQMVGHSSEIRGKLIKHVFKIQLTNMLNLVCQVIQDFIVNGSSKKIQ